MREKLGSMQDFSILKFKVSKLYADILRSTTAFIFVLHLSTY